MSDEPFTLTRTFDAPVALVWRAWTDPRLARRWWHPYDFTIEHGVPRIDPVVGGGFSYTLVDPEKARIALSGTYLEVEAERRLVFTWGPAELPAEAQARITVDLEDTGVGLTLMTFTATGLPAEDGVDEEDSVVRTGWTECFELLDIWFSMGIM
ncbi:SRPBCC domain-containing protein [Brevibacterium samyangense]|uniref:SRPBCC family protein n=1 Tax=Brevibacterium samyangense TaxID=366888 RepID=A0ABP5EH89_9MICO